ncbi:shikimate dehydrogenase family protein [Brevibacterium aurantiacum]|uniref:Shikimate dehydrogenase n=1 Tax=Brevibacterium aurantiacum TaxID=273384 RepID=A0A2A3ZDT7_BREAU|nr:shikimate dehydrogenase [Brevibacterium aurantiacum]PCC49657.1 shikimate dehydrogenase [Brevibacterium aurantiacum]TGD39892.1 shikimate dehydrogenase [Brevibacterium aurantiacum]
MTISAAVLGRPIAHSKSPLLHRAAFQALGLHGSEYASYDLGADELEAFLADHDQEVGFSLTMPLKEQLVELARAHGWDLDDTAGLTGVANTLVRSASSTAVANTDVQGIVRALAPGLTTSDTEYGDRATILGAGATAASALLACHELGITSIEFLVRNPDRARRVLELSQRLGITATTAPLRRIEPAAIIISTLPAEAVPELQWSPDFHSGVALDVAYAAESGFLRAAEAHGLIPVEGTVMLVEQAVAQSEMFIAAAESQNAETELRNTETADGGDRRTRDSARRAAITVAMYRALEDAPGPVGD